MTKSVTVGDLEIRTGIREMEGAERIATYRPATVADLMSPEIRPLVVSALRAEEWELHVIDEIEGGIREVLGYAVPECNAGTLALKVVLDALAEAQPFPPAGE